MVSCCDFSLVGDSYKDEILTTMICIYISVSEEITVVQVSPAADPRDVEVSRTLANFKWRPLTLFEMYLHPESLQLRVSVQKTGYN